MHSQDLKNLLSGNVDGMKITQEFLLSFAIMMEIPMIMIVLSKVLKFKINRILNMVFALIMGIIQIWSLGVGNITLHYTFFSIVEIATCLIIFFYAYKWKNNDLNVENE